jgi:hypothetical protein
MPKRYTVEELKIMFEGNPNWKDAPFEETRILPPPTEYATMLARLTPEPLKQPSPAIAVDFNETEINGPEDMLMEIVRLKGILNAILAAWNKSTTMPPDLTEKELLAFIQWIKTKRKEDSSNPGEAVLRGKSQNQRGKSHIQIDNENWAKKIYG